MPEAPEATQGLSRLAGGSSNLGKVAALRWVSTTSLDHSLVPGEGHHGPLSLLQDSWGTVTETTAPLTCDTAETFEGARRSWGCLGLARGNLR